MYFNAFHMNCVVHQSPGLWTRDDDHMVDYKRLDSWIEFAKLIERGKFDAIFLADVVGTYDVFGGSRDASVRSAAQFPVNDPMLLIPPMSAVTRNLGFGFTSSVLQAHPFTFARQITTLDHLTNGRVGWNIVTSYLESTGRAYGLGGLPDHDVRYDMADEFCRLCYKLWEDSWADDAVLADRKKGIYADPGKVRDVAHEGDFFKFEGCHISEPSPQRTPVLFQAGSSPRGAEFAGTHGECVFVIGANPTIAGNYVKNVRAQMVKQGRRPEDVLGFAYMKVITGGTEQEALARRDEYLEQIDYEGAMSLMGGWAGTDLSALDPDQPVKFIETNAVRTMLHSFTEADPTREWTVRDIARYVGLGGAGPVLVGAPEQIADQLETWIDAGVDGFNLSYATLPRSFEDFIDGVVPVLQRRGRMQTEYAEGTLREKLFPGRGPRIAHPHPAATCRRPW
jgi:FMN-dependent oxidoreductase (nitrilotriacetate monooxygenase family)